jgi:PIN domain nuclease of toxin-antitoxin system
MDGARNEAVISAVVSWEMAIKVSLGKLDAWRLVAELPEILRQRGFAELPITIDQSVRVASLPLHHRDPFDRLLVAQAQDLNLPILSADKLLDLYDVKRLW